MGIANKPTENRIRKTERRGTRTGHVRARRTPLTLAHTHTYTIRAPRAAVVGGRDTGGKNKFTHVRGGFRIISVDTDRKVGKADFRNRRVEGNTKTSEPM